MQLLVLILKHVELVNELVKELAEAGVHGGTSIDGTGMAGTLANMEDLPMFGILRRVLSDEEKELSKILLFVIKDEQAAEARAVIKRVAGNLNKPNTGILFSLPITYVEGLGD